MSPLALSALSTLLASLPGAHPLAAPGVTSLTNPDVKFKPAADHAVELRRADVTIVVADNAEGGPLIPGHRAGYNGIASLTHAKRRENLFVPTVAGLNFEHIHDGTLAVEKEKFEPRVSPMSLRLVDEFTVELHQPPTPNWKLESCGRYHLLPDGAIEYTFECIPRADVFRQKWIGLFWASYIHQPEEKGIRFLAREAKSDDPFEWILSVSPRHGVDATHPPGGPLPELNIDPRFPLTLVNHPSKHVYGEPWYYGVSHGMAYVQMFRARDRIWFAQSPSGGGGGNPAWDFQWFIPEAKVGEAYGFVMRAAYLPFESRRQIEAATRPHRAALNPD